MNLRRLLLFPMLLLCLASCLASPEVRVSSVSLLTTRTAVSDDANNSVAAVGYLKVQLTADVDLAKRASDDDADLWYAAETCETHVKLSVWPYPLASGGNSYTVLIAYKDTKGGTYNLASGSEDICMTIGVGSMNPVTNARSKVVRHTLPNELKDELRAYDSSRGAVELQLSPECQSHMCRPTYRTKKAQ